MTKFRIQSKRLNNKGIMGTRNIKNIHGGIDYDSRELAQLRVGDLNRWYVKNGNYDLHGIKEYKILPIITKQNSDDPMAGTPAPAIQEKQPEYKNISEIGNNVKFVVNEDEDTVTIDDIVYTDCYEKIGGVDENLLDTINEMLAKVSNKKIVYHTDKKNDITYMTII